MGLDFSINGTFGRQNNWSFFNNYFKVLYPNMYKDMIGDSTPPSETPVATPMQRQQREGLTQEEEDARTARLLQDRIDEKTKLQGQVMSGGVPDVSESFGVPGQSPAVNTFMSGFATESGMGSMGLSGKAGEMIASIGEKQHTININALIESKGKSGGVGKVWSPNTGFVSVSLGVKPLSQTVAGVVQKITGSDSPSMKTVHGNLPRVFVYDGKVYNRDRDYSAFVKALEANSEKVYQQHLELTAAADGLALETDTINNRNSKPDVFDGFYAGQSKMDLGVYNEKTGTFSKATKTSTSPIPVPVFGDATEERFKPIERTPEQEKQAETYKQEFKKEQEEQQKDTGGDKYTQVGEFEFNTGGFIGGMNPNQVTDAQTVADDYPIDSDDGDFMINAAAIEKDPQRFNEIISAGLQKAREKGIEVGDISGVGMDESGDVLASKGEFLVKKPLAETIGYDTLNQFNDQGKPEVDRRVAASGGFLDGYANGGDIDLPKSKPSFKDRGEITLNRLYNSVQSPYTLDRLPALRDQVEKYIREMPEENVLALASIIEGSQLGDKGMEAVMHIVNNRAKTNYKDFSNINSIVDAVVQKTSEKGAFQFTAFEPNKLVNQLDDMMYSGYGRKKYQEQIKIAKDVISGKRPDFTDGALFYWNPYKATSSPIYRSIDEFKKEVKNGNVIMTYQIGSGNKMHQMFRPKDAGYPEKTLSLIDTPEPRPERPTERLAEAQVQEETPPESFITGGSPLALDRRGMFGTYLSNRAKPFLSMQQGS
jgi:hypothetical protein